MNPTCEIEEKIGNKFQKHKTQIYLKNSSGDNVFYLSYLEDNQNKILEDIKLKQSNHNEVRRAAMSSIKNWLNESFTPPVRQIEEVELHVTSDVLTFNATRTSYAWNVSYEEWIFQEVESQILPFLNHSISQLIFLGEEEKWESVKIYSGVIDVFVHAIYDDQMNYITKDVKLIIKMASHSAAVEIGYVAISNGFNIQITYSYAEFIVRGNFNVFLEDNLANFEGKLKASDIWTRFEHEIPICCVSAKVSYSSLWPFLIRVSCNEEFEDYYKATLMGLERVWKNLMNSLELKSRIRKLIKIIGKWMKYFDKNFMQHIKEYGEKMNSENISISLDFKRILVDMLNNWPK